MQYLKTLRSRSPPLTTLLATYSISSFDSTETQPTLNALLDNRKSAWNLPSVNITISTWLHFFSSLRWCVSRLVAFPSSVRVALASFVSCIWVVFGYLVYFRSKCIVSYSRVGRVVIWTFVSYALSFRSLGFAFRVLFSQQLDLFVSQCWSCNLDSHIFA